MLERKRPHLLRQIDGMAARLRPERLAAASEQIRPTAAVARAARALLAVELGAGIIDLGAALHRDGAAAPLGELVAHHAMQDVGARLEPEHMVGERDRSRLLGVESGYVGLHHSWLPASAFSALACFSSFGHPPPALRKPPAFR